MSFRITSLTDQHIKVARRLGDVVLMCRQRTGRRE